MASMHAGIPYAAVPVSIVVLLYSFICFTTCFLLVLLLVSFGERWTYVTLLSMFTALSTLFSIVQQLHYATSWLIIKEAQFEEAIKNADHPAMTFGGVAEKVDVILFFIQYYCYNVISLSILFWTVALFVSSWNLRLRWLGNWRELFPQISKAFTIMFPVLIVGLLQSEAILDSVGCTIIVAYSTMFVGLTIGGVLLVLITYKYIRTRRLVAESSDRGRWWASASSSDPSQGHSHNATIDSEELLDGGNSIYDRALLIRFSIGFIVLALFEAAIIMFSLFKLNDSSSIAGAGEPDFTLSNTISDIVFFIPGVTASLVVFLVFGTTKSWRQYWDLISGACGMRRKLAFKAPERRGKAHRSQGLEFQRLDSLPHLGSQNNQQKDIENRVRMSVERSTSLSASRESSTFELPKIVQLDRLSLSGLWPMPQRDSRIPAHEVLDTVHSFGQESTNFSNPRRSANLNGIALQNAPDPNTPRESVDQSYKVKFTPHHSGDYTPWPSP